VPCFSVQGGCEVRSSGALGLRWGDGRTGVGGADWVVTRRERAVCTAGPSQVLVASRHSDPPLTFY
jgi:hypothetical protein